MSNLQIFINFFFFHHILSTAITPLFMNVTKIFKGISEVINSMCFIFFFFFWNYEFDLFQLYIFFHIFLHREIIMSHNESMAAFLLRKRKYINVWNRFLQFLYFSWEKFRLTIIYLYASSYKFSFYFRFHSLYT